MIGTPYIALAAAASIAIAGFGGYRHGRSVERGEQAESALKQERQGFADRLKTEHKIGVLETQAAEKELVRDTEVRYVYKEIPKVIRADPVYLNQCINDDGVLLLDRAAQAANGGANPGPSASGPGDAPNGRADGRSGDKKGKGGRGPSS